MTKVKAYVLFDEGSPADCVLDLKGNEVASKSYLQDEMADWRESNPDYHFYIRRADANTYIEAVHERAGRSGKELIDWLIEDLQGAGVSVEKVLEEELKKHIAKPAKSKRK